MTRRSMLAIGVSALILGLVGLYAFGPSASSSAQRRTFQEASPVGSPVTESLVEIEPTVQPQRMADVSVARVSVCIQYQTPAQSVGNPPAYGNSPIFLYWWDAAKNEWHQWLRGQTDGTGCGAFTGLVPQHYYVIHAYIKVQSPVAREGAGIIVDAWTKPVYVDSLTTNINMGTYVLPNYAP